MASVAENVSQAQTEERTMENRSNFDRRDETILMIVAFVTPLLAVPAMLGV